MKIASFTAEVQSGIKVFKPVQYLCVQGSCPKQEFRNVKMRVRLVNSENGRVDEIIPMLELNVLGEIASMNEGFFMHQQFYDGNDSFKVNVMLHPTSAIYLSNDKYLEIDIEGLSTNAETNIYGIEQPIVDKDFICRYNKFYMAAGELQKTFMVGENENLIIPDFSFEEILLNYKNGSTCAYLTAELGALMMLKNDVVSLPDTRLTQQIFTSNTYVGYEYCFGYRNMYGLDVSDVESFTLRRSNGTASFEFVMIDSVKG